MASARPSGRIVCFGEAMHRTANGEVTPGGAEYNVACALARLEIPTAWVSVLPKDEVLIRNAATDAGVHLDLQDSDHLIGTYDVDLENHLVEYNRKNSAFSHLDASNFEWRELLSGARWLVLSGITPLLGEGLKTAWAGALTFAELDGTLIALDLNHRPALGTIESLWEIIRPRMRMLHVLVLAPDSLASIAKLEGISPPSNYEENIEALTELRRRFLIPHLCCTFKRPETDGKQKRWSVIAHAFGTDSTEEEAILHSPIEKLGGGDAWLAGFIDALSEHGHGPVSPLIGAMRGDLLAALSQNSWGDISMVTRDELDQFESKRNWNREGVRILDI